ncbi:MAG: RDD family protein, partial [Chitinophagales bacterium]|nr:RDD family protein [Chitinophagales bacterium]
DEASQAGMITMMATAYIGLITSGIVLNWLYYAFMESSTKQATLGKMALNIKVTDMQGNRITFLNATGRYFGKIISSLIMGIGYIMAGFTEKKQALHDIVAGTLVVVK